MLAQCANAFAVIRWDGFHAQRIQLLLFGFVDEPQAM